VTLITDPAAPVVLFPGQGSQTPEMRDLVAERAPDLLERCVALVGEDPFPRASDSTRFAQPAIFCASLAGWDALDLDAVAGAGHSLGELAALAAAGVIERDDALRLVVLRGRLMADADQVGTMLALIGATEDETRAIAEAAEVTVANDNAPGQVVISGPRSELAHATDELKSIGAKRVIPLRVSAAFHSPAMQEAAPRLREAIDVTPFSALRYRLIANVDARVHEHAREMPALLEKQVWSPVQWVASVERSHGEGASAFVEFGPGTVLTGLIKRILPNIVTGNVSDEGTLRQSLPLLKGDAR